MQTKRLTLHVLSRTKTRTAAYRVRARLVLSFPQYPDVLCAWMATTTPRVFPRVRLIGMCASSTKGTTAFVWAWRRGAGLVAIAASTSRGKSVPSGRRASSGFDLRRVDNRMPRATAAGLDSLSARVCRPMVLVSRVVPKNIHCSTYLAAVTYTAYLF